LARQRRNEAPAEFLDRLRTLVRRTIPCETVPALQRAFEIIAERRLVSSFTTRCVGTAGRQLRVIRPTKVDEALQIAETAGQADEFDARDKTFYAMDATQSSPADRVQESGKRQNSA
jgi:hypothetical protein